MSWSMDLDPKGKWESIGINLIIVFHRFLGANNQLKENADKLYSKDEDLLFGMEDMVSSVTEDGNSQMQSQSSLQDIQPMDSSEEILWTNMNLSVYTLIEKKMTTQVYVFFFLFITILSVYSYIE